MPRSDTGRRSLFPDPCVAIFFLNFFLNAGEARVRGPPTPGWPLDNRADKRKQCASNCAPYLPRLCPIK
jgi:hypothetical protein